MALIQILLALILPPVAVALERGVGKHLLLSIVLTILGWLPGVLHALWVVFKEPRPATV